MATTAPPRPPTRPRPVPRPRPRRRCRARRRDYAILLALAVTATSLWATRLAEEIEALPPVPGRAGAPRS